MDSTRAILESQYPRCRWTRLGTHWSGRCGSVMVAVYRTNAGWCADGQTEVGAAVHHGTGQNMHTALMNLVSFSPKFIDALNPTPYEQPQSTPFPASGLWWLGKGCLWVAVDVARELLPSRWTLLFVAAMVLACGVGGLDGVALLLLGTIGFACGVGRSDVAAMLFLGAMALGCGAGGMWWLTGGGQ